jgi:hypothetical protein
MLKADAELKKENEPVSKTEDNANAPGGATVAAAPSALEPSNPFGAVVADGRNYAVANLLATGYSNDFSATSDTRGLYIPGHGVIYSTDIQIPLKTKEAGTQDGSNDEGDAWDEASQTVVNGNTIFYTSPVSLTTNKKPKEKYVFDERYIDAAIDAVIRSVGRYGNRIDQLPSSESVTVAVRLVGSSNSLYNVVTYRSIVGWRNGNESEQGRLVIELPGSVLGTITADTTDLTKIRSQCRITRY